MEVKFLIGVLALVLTSTIAMASGKGNGGTTPQGKPFIVINDKIQVIESVQLTIQDQIDELVGVVDTLEDRLYATESAITALQSEDIALHALIDAHDGNIDDLVAEIARLDAENIVLNAAIADGDSVLQDQVDINYSLISALQIAVGAQGALQLQIDDLVAINVTLQAAIDSGDSTLQFQIDANVGLIDGLQNQIDALGTLQTQISANAGLISGLQSQIDDLQGQIDMNLSYMNRECPVNTTLFSTNEDGSYACEVDDEGIGGITGFSQVRVYSQYLLDPGYYANVHAYCPAGYMLTGGGSWGGQADVYIVGSIPAIYSANVDDTNYALSRAWRTYAVNSSIYSREIYSMAVCIKAL